MIFQWRPTVEGKLRIELFLGGVSAGSNDEFQNEYLMDVGEFCFFFVKKL